MVDTFHHVRLEDIEDGPITDARKLSDDPRIASFLECWDVLQQEAHFTNDAQEYMERFNRALRRCVTQVINRRATQQAKVSK